MSTDPSFVLAFIITQTIEKVAAGDITQRTDIRSADELGKLGRSFNVMADNLRLGEVHRALQRLRCLSAR